MFALMQLVVQTPLASGQSNDPWATMQNAPNSDLSQLLTELEELRARHARTQTETQHLLQSEARIKSALTVHTRGLVRLKRMGTLPLAAGVEALQTHSARVQRMERLVKNDLQQIKTLQIHKADLESTAHQLSQVIAKQEQYLATLQLDPSSAWQLPVSSLPDTLGTWNKVSDSVNDFGLRTHDSGSDSSLPPAAVEGFAALKGTLGSPLDNYSQVRDAKRPESEGPGLEFLASAGTSVHAVAAARVAFADRYGSYGRIVILDHGQRYYTVYGGLGDYAVHVGDTVSQGARLGTVGSSSNPPALFFEVRLGTRTLEARPWLQLD